jgi:hypothetical protein
MWVLLPCHCFSDEEGGMGWGEGMKGGDEGMGRGDEEMMVEVVCFIFLL